MFATRIKKLLTLLAVIAAIGTASSPAALASTHSQAAPQVRPCAGC
jgi:hypothetical protein